MRNLRIAPIRVRNVNKPPIQAQSRRN